MSDFTKLIDLLERRDRIDAQLSILREKIKAKEVKDEEQSTSSS